MITMTNVLVVNKNGKIEENVVGLDKIYTVCDYKSTKDFELIYSYENYEIYGKIKGKSENENKYTFPTITNTLYGKICIIKKNNLPISLNEWNIFCKKDIETENILNDNELTYEDYEPE